MIKEIEDIEYKHNVVVELLTYSLSGLAIPIVTIGYPPFNNKNVTLISSRIHPG